MAAFTEIKINKNIVIRKFSKDVNDKELKWHFDLENRVLVPLNENNWRLQLDNQLPFNIDGNTKIPSNIWHRLIKGDSDLYLLILKEKNG